jgi:hypothetical protein
MHRLICGDCVQEISPKTVKDVDLSALKSVFGWGADNHHLPANPARTMTLKLGKPGKERSKGFSDTEAIDSWREASAGHRLPEAAAVNQRVDVVLTARFQHSGLICALIVETRRKGLAPSWKNLSDHGTSRNSNP